MKTTEKILCIAFLLGLILKFGLIPGSGLIITFSLIILGMLYFYLGFALFNNVSFKGIFKKDSYRGISTIRIIGAIASGISVSTVCIGLLFKLQHWPMASTNLVIGFALSMIVLVISLFKAFKSKDSYYRRVIKRLLPAIILAGALLLISDISIIRFQYRNYPDYIKTYEMLQKDPANEALREKLYYEGQKVYLDSATIESIKEYRNQQNK